MMAHDISMYHRYVCFVMFATCVDMTLTVVTVPFILMFCCLAMQLVGLATFILGVAAKVSCYHGDVCVYVGQCTR